MVTPVTTPTTRTVTTPSTPEVSSDVATNQPAPVATAESVQTPASSWGPKASTAPAPSKVDKLLTQAKGKVVEAAINQIADEHTFGKDLNSGAFTSNVKLGEEVALKDSKVYDTLVKPDRLRSNYAQANGDSAWVKTRAVLAAGANVGFTPGAGVGLNMGFNGNVEVSSVMPQKADSFKDVGGIISSQAKSMVYPLDADGLASLNAAPGTEWMFRGQGTVSAGVTVGQSESAGIPIVSATATLGVSAGVSAQATYTKNVKVLENNKVFVQVGRTTSEGASGAIGLNAGLTINAASTVTGALSDKGVGSAGPVNLANEGGKLADSALNQVENKTRITGQVSASATATQKVLAQAVLDLSTPAGKAAFDQIIRGGPADAAEFINKNGLGVTFTDDAHALNTGATLKFGSSNLLSTSTFRGTENGTVLDAGSSTQLSETTYGRSVGGFLPRLFVGEERNVSVRAGALQKGDGPQQHAVAVTLAVNDPRVHADEVQQLQRFAKGMGASLEGLPQDKDSHPGTYSVQVALTDENITKFQAWGKDDLRLAFASAQKDIEGGTTLPVWFDKPETFQSYVRRYQSANSGGRSSNMSQNISQEYARDFPGRSLLADMATTRAIDDMSKQALEARGQPIEKWGKLLESVGRQSSSDIRTSILALRRLSGAEIVELSATVDGKAATVKAETTAPKTMAQVVGELMAPPN